MEMNELMDTKLEHLGTEWVNSAVSVGTQKLHSTALEMFFSQ